MGKIMEKENELIELKKELENAEIERMSGIGSFEFMPVTSEDVHEIHDISELSVPLMPEPTPENNPLTHIALKEDIDSQHPRKIINIDKVLQLVDGDQTLASEISAGKNTSVKWGSRTYVLAWCNGRKYDPTNSRISNLRTELRRCPRSIRGLSSITGLAIDTVKDLVREMDKQGFFLA